MTKQNLISLSNKDEWKKTLQGIQHSFAHTWENCYAMHLTTGFDTYLYCFEKDDVKILCPIAERTFDEHRDIVTPYGFSGFTGNKDFSDFPKYWKEFVTEKNYVCGYISLNPLVQNKTYFKVDDCFMSTSLYFIDLTLSLTGLFDNLDSNRKKQIVNYRKFESAFIYDRNELTKFFTANYYSFLKRINASSANYFKKETLEYICSLENVFMVGTGSRKCLEAVYIFAHTPYSGDCLFNVATEEGRQYSSLLLWCGLKFFRSKKIPVMNLGGGVKENDGVSQSKQRFGANRLPLMNLKQIYDSGIYEKLCKKKGIDPGDLSGYFPAYRKNLNI